MKKSVTYSISSCLQSVVFCDEGVHLIFSRTQCSCLFVAVLASWAACVFALSSTPIVQLSSQKLIELEASSGGRLGVSATNTGHHERIQYRAQERFPMGCTSKVVGAAALLKASTRDPQLLHEKATYTQKYLDFSGYSPITPQHLAEGMTFFELGAAAVSYSDNTAMNLIAKKLGGVQELNVFARSIGDPDFKADHLWPEEAQASPDGSSDSTTPAAMEETLKKLALGHVLALRHRKSLVQWMKDSVTGNLRIRAGVPKGWVVGDKTGTGSYGSTNDIAIIWPPQCAPIVVAIYSVYPQKEAPNREDVIASATRILLDEFSKTDRCVANAQKNF